MSKSLTLKEWIVHRTLCWIRAWIEIVIAILSIVTLTLYRPSWDMRFIAKTSHIVMNMKKNRLNKQLSESGLDEHGRPKRCRISELME